MKMRRAIVGLLLLAAVLLAGCGDNASADRKAMDRKFEQIDFKISSLETITSTYNQPHFEQETDRYIALVRRYADLLGPAEAKKRLNQKGDELSSFCLPCAGRLTDEAAKY
jgi:PBP1b-binding outer membrane lipoprotein LpoB